MLLKEFIILKCNETKNKTSKSKRVCEEIFNLRYELHYSVFKIIETYNTT